MVGRKRAMMMMTMPSPAVPPERVRLPAQPRLPVRGDVLAAVGCCWIARHQYGMRRTATTSTACMIAGSQPQPHSSVHPALACVGMQCKQTAPSGNGAGTPRHTMKHVATPFLSRQSLLDQTTVATSCPSAAQGNVISIGQRHADATPPALQAPWGHFLTAGCRDAPAAPLPRRLPPAASRASDAAAARAATWRRNSERWAAARRMAARRSMGWCSVRRGWSSGRPGPRSTMPFAKSASYLCARQGRKGRGAAGPWCGGGWRPGGCGGLVAHTAGAGVEQAHANAMDMGAP